MHPMPGRSRPSPLPPRAGRTAALLAALLAGAVAGPAEAQWRYGATANPAATLEAPAGNLAGYAMMVDTWSDRLGAAVREVEAEAPTDPQEGTMSRPRMHLLDTAQTAWVVIQNVPEGLDGAAAYQAADRQFRDAIAAMRLASTPTPQALAEARKVIAALELLERAAIEAARRAAR
jgi:hypothetical protein